MPGITEIYSGTLWEAEMVKTMLADAGIDCFLKNHVLHTNLYDPIKAEGVKVMIASEQESQALIIVNDYRQNQKAQ